MSRDSYRRRVHHVMDYIRDHLDHALSGPSDRVRCDLGFAVDGSVQADGDIGIYDLPVVTAVEVPIRGPLVRVAVAWSYLSDEWLPATAYEPANLPAMKRFRLRPDQIGWECFDLSCSLPVHPLEP